MATLSFAHSYSRNNITAFSTVQSRWGIMLALSQRQVLEAFASRAVAVALSGYVFFGSAITVSEKVLEVSRARPGTSLDIGVSQGRQHALLEVCGWHPLGGKLCAACSMQAFYGNVTLAANVSQAPRFQ